MSRRNRDLNQSRKSINIGVSEIDQKRVENRKNLWVVLCFCSDHNMAYGPSNWMIPVGDEN